MVSSVGCIDAHRQKYLYTLAQTVAQILLTGMYDTAPVLNTGEVLSYYLSRLLGLDNIPVVVLSRVNSSAPQWQGQNLTRAEWEEGQMVALIEWQEGLESQRSV